MSSRNPARRTSQPKHVAQAPFVTISRQAGARGHELANAILAALQQESGAPALRGWDVFDHQICTKILKGGKLRADLQTLLSENYRSAIEDYIFSMFSGQPSQTTVYYEIFKVVRALALAGKAVIVGRAAACYTQDIAGGLHLRLVASEETRLAVLGKLEGVPETQARKRARELDDSRAKIARTYFKRDIEDPLLYNAIWNVDRTPVSMIASFVVSWIKRESAALSA